MITNNVTIWLLLSELPGLICSKSLLYTAYRYLVYRLIVIIGLILSVYLCPKVITLGAFTVSKARLPQGLTIQVSR
jgi:hypothetical protein